MYCSVQGLWCGPNRWSYVVPVNDSLVILNASISQGISTRPPYIQYSRAIYPLYTHSTHPLLTVLVQSATIVSYSYINLLFVSASVSSVLHNLAAPITIPHINFIISRNTLSCNNISYNVYQGYKFPYIHSLSHILLLTAQYIHSYQSSLLHNSCSSGTPIGVSDNSIVCSPKSA